MNPRPLSSGGSWAEEGLLVGVKQADTVKPAASTAVPTASGGTIDSAQVSTTLSPSGADPAAAAISAADITAGPETKARDTPGLAAPSPSPAPVPAPARATAPAPAPAPARATAPADPQGLSLGAWIGIGASCLVGVSALITIAYNVWKWKNKLNLIAAKSGSQTHSASSGSSKPFIV
jgi:hypothetical protein